MFIIHLFFFNPPTPNTIQLSFNKKLCWISVKKKQPTTNKNNQPGGPNNLYESQLTHQQKNNQPGNQVAPGWEFLDTKKHTPNNLGENQNCKQKQPTRWPRLKFLGPPNLCSKTADPRQTPVAPMAWTLQRPSRPCYVRQDPHPQHSWLPRRNRSCDLRDIFSMATNGRYDFTKIWGLKINQMIGRYALCTYICWILWVWVFVGVGMVSPNISGT